MWISQREYDRLLADVERERERADREQGRADAAVNQALLEAGRAPLPSGQPVTNMLEEAKTMMSAFAEVYGDGDDSDVVDGEGMMRMAPEAVAALAGVK